MSKDRKRIYFMNIRTSNCCRGIFMTLVLAFVLSFLSPDRAHAIPAFSRLYKTECTTCHTIFSQRTEFGEAFRLNGYVWPGAKPLPEKDTAPKSVEQLKFEELLNLTGLPPILPISLVASDSIKYDNNNSNKFDFNNASLELFAGGSLKDTIGFFILAPLGEDSSIEILTGVWRHALDTPLNVRFGKIQPEVSLWNETNKLISTPITIRDINGLALADAQNGIELDTVVGSRLLLEAGIVEREIGDTPGGDTVSKKEYYGHAAVKIGGTDFLGKEPEVDLDNPSIWDFLAIRVGVFGYTGKDLDSDALTSGDTSDLYRAGLETEILYKKWRAMLAGVIGQDEDSVNPTVKSTGFSGEVNYQFMAKLIGVVHYDYLNQKEGDGITRHIIPGVVFAPLQTFRIKLYVNKELDEKSHNTTGTMSVTWAF